MAFKINDRIKRSKKMWVNGEFMDWDDCKVHVMSHVLHYASALFEGIRCYKTRKGSQVFRIREHVRRLYDSCKIYRMDLPVSQDDFLRACL